MSDLMNLVRLTQKPKTVPWLREKLGLDDRQLTALLKQAQKEEYDIRAYSGYICSRSSLAPRPVSTGLETAGKPGDRIRIALITDLHFGSKHCDTKGIQRFLNFAKGQGAQALVITGDILDGNKEVLLADQIYTGWDEQAKLCVDTISAWKGPVIAIDGNHDGYFSSAIGSLSGRMLSDLAGPRWHYAGNCLGQFQLCGAKWQLWHPHGGASTRNAIRRVLNARIEALENPCDILALGHFHKFATVQAYPEMVFGIAGGTFQRKGSEFSNRLTSGWDVGGSIISYTRTKTGVAEVAAEFFPVGAL